MSRQAALGAASVVLSAVAILLVGVTFALPGSDSQQDQQLTETQAAPENPAGFPPLSAQSETELSAADPGPDPDASTTTQLLDRITMEPQEIVLEAGRELQIEVVAFDRSGDPIAGFEVSFLVADEAGRVTGDGRLTAGTVAGVYDGGLTVEATHGEIAATATATVTVKPGPLARVEIVPAGANLTVEEERRFAAVALDRFGNPIPDLDQVFLWDQRAGRMDQEGGFFAGTLAGSYPHAVSVQVTQGGLTRGAAADVTVGPGPLARVILVPSDITLEVASAVQLAVTGVDRFDNLIPGLSYEIAVDETAGMVDRDGLLTAGTVAGLHADAITVEARQDDTILTALAGLTVSPGPLASIELSPAAVSVGIGQESMFEAQPSDAYGNRIDGADLVWSAAADTGTITADGLLTAGTRSGTTERAITVTAVLGGTSVEATSAVTVRPGPLESISLASVEIAAGESAGLLVVAVDEHGNRLTNPEIVWAVVDPNAGTIDESGRFTAGEVAGQYADAIQVRATDGELTLTAASPVTIVPGPLDQVVVAPSATEIGMSMSQQFVAVGADRFGNRISGLELIWSAQGGGVIDADGLFTAGTDPGSYGGTVAAAATQGEATRSDTASVAVQPDRIVYTSGRSDRLYDIVIMDADGSEVEKLATSGTLRPSWSPDGRRIAHDSQSQILTANDDGTWWNVAISTQDGASPAWSPDGLKFAFVSRRDGNSEIYVMDLDGGHQTRLTSNRSKDYQPSWSPDGARVAFVSKRDGNPEIYVMDADGGNIQRLTVNSGNGHLGFDEYPAWSPDGQQILFESGRSEGRSAIFVMNADGSDPRQVTLGAASYGCPSWSPDGQAILFHLVDGSGSADIYRSDLDGRDAAHLTATAGSEYCPRWAPRKPGIEVSSETLVIPNSSALAAMSLSEVAAKVRHSVVRIKTDLASGSGAIIDENGLILTNNHVISDATTITVHLDDVTTYIGRVRARDMVRDLALVEVDATGLPTVELGDVGRSQLASEVVVLGYPLDGADLTVTRGILSAFKPDPGRNIGWIQTDAAVNPGNSGGPLLNLQGQIIGMITAKYVDVSVEGIGLAITVNTLRLYLDRLR